MKRLLVVSLLVAAIVVAAAGPADAHAIRCAAYVGNEGCFQHAAMHDWFHRIIAFPFGIIR